MKSDYFEQRRKMLSDAFHTLNQPLTGLHCGLEIALQRPRSEGEYRKRISDGIEQASAILQLLKAVRQLVDAADPGERFGTVSVPVLMSQLKSELEVVAEASQVSLTIKDGTAASVDADPGKLLQVLGSLAAAEIASYQPEAVVSITTKRRKKWLECTISGNGEKVAKNQSEKISEIRRNAATSYIWTLGGEVKVIDDGILLTLPISDT